MSAQAAALRQYLPELRVAAVDIRGEVRTAFAVDDS